jgi:hypothetical protein
MTNPYSWWIYVRGAQWRQPRGPGSSVRKLGDHPVVQVAWVDVEAFPPNRYGLYETTHEGDHACCAPLNPVGGERERSFDPEWPVRSFKAYQPVDRWAAPRYW